MLGRAKREGSLQNRQWECIMSVRKNTMEAPWNHRISTWASNPTFQNQLNYSSAGTRMKKCGTCTQFLKLTSKTGKRLGPRNTAEEQGCANHVPEPEAGLLTSQHCGQASVCLVFTPHWRVMRWHRPCVSLALQLTVSCCLAWNSCPCFSVFLGTDSPSTACT